MPSAGRENTKERIDITAINEQPMMKKQVFLPGMLDSLHCHIAKVNYSVVKNRFTEIIELVREQLIKELNSPE